MNISLIYGSAVDFLSVELTHVILAPLLFHSACMRRFIVLFLLFILPLQVLAASIDDLNAIHGHPVHAGIVPAESASPHVDSVSSKLLIPVDGANPLPVHADLNDSVGISDAHCLPGDLSVSLRPRYIAVNFSDVFLPVIKPPVI